MNVQEDSDRIVAAYLKHLEKAAEPLPESRRTDLLADVTSHIAEARAAGATSPAAVRQMLQRLGDPDELVAASTDGLVLVDAYRPTFRGREILALTLLALGGFIALIGWVAGVVLLWTSDRWTRNEKWLGTLVWPLGFVFVFFVVTARFGDLSLPTWLGIPIAVLVGLAPLFTLGVLIKNAAPGRAHQ